MSPHWYVDRFLKTIYSVHLHLEPTLAVLPSAQQAEGAGVSYTRQDCLYHSPVFQPGHQQEKSLPVGLDELSRNQSGKPVHRPAGPTVLFGDNLQLAHHWPYVSVQHC